jgi:uncharacterized protein YybS (DUF2232 family)
VQRLGVIGRFLLALASSVLLCLTIMVPPAGMALVPLSPQPVLSFGLRYGVGWGAGVLLTATLLFAIFLGEALALVYGLLALLAGMLFGLLGRVRSIEYLVLDITAVIYGLTAGVMFYLFGSWSAMVGEFRASMSQQVAGALRVHEKMGLPQDSLELLKERMPQILDTMLQLLPALVFMGLAFVVLVNVVLLLRRFPERRGEWLSLASLREWKGPEFLVWGLIACGFAMFIPGLESVRVVSANVLVIIAACYFAQGLAVIAYFFHKNKVPRFLRGVTYVLIVFQQIFTLLVVGLGLFDLWGDFRRLGKDNLTPNQVA